MKERLLSLCLLLALVCGLFGCSFSFSGADGSSPFSTSVTVTLRYGNGEADGALTVPVGARIAAPPAPTREKYIFLGWYTDATCTTLYDFSKAVGGAMTLYAGYLPDHAAWANRLTESSVPALVRITNNGQSTLGSGIVFRKGTSGASTVYYVLTNNHVVANASGGFWLSSPLTVTDYRGHSDYRVETLCRDAAYDLAVLCVTALPGTSSDLSVVSLAEADAAVGDPIAALGHPKQQYNAMTFGTVLAYRAMDEKDYADKFETSQITFPVMQHTAPTDHGSSGGACLDIDGALVAVSFAGAYGEDDIIRYGLAVPIGQIRTFLAANEASLGFTV